MDFFELIQKRQSCRNYSDRPVEPEKIKQIMTAAGLSPSASNSQPWKYIVVSDKEKAAAVARSTQRFGINKFTENCPVMIVVLSDKSRVSAISERITKMNLSSIDLGLSLAHLTLAATEIGLATCIIGMVNEPETKKILGLGSRDEVEMIVALGYAADGDPIRPKKRKSVEDIYITV